MRRVQHSSYGQGTVIATSGNIATVQFDNGITKDVSENELLDVILG